MTDRTPIMDLALVRQLWLREGRQLAVQAFKWLLAVGVVGTVVAAGVGAWRFSDLVYQEVFEFVIVPEAFDHAAVADVGVDSVTLQRGPGATPTLVRDGTMGIRWRSGYATLGPVLAEAGDLVTRSMTPGAGVLAEGEGVAVDGVVFYGDPETDRGIPFEEVEIGSDLGENRAWFIEGISSTWAVYVHGRGTDRTEALRLLPTTVHQGMPALVIRYRNDPGSPHTGRSDYGITEYRDLEAAVRFAIERGAERVVLVGYSMGGAIVGEFLHHSPFAGRTSGIVLDSPMLDLSVVIDQQAAERGIPSLLSSAAKTTVAFRFGVNWSDLNFVPKLVDAGVPVLVFHGTEDDVVPIDLSRRLRDAAPELVQLHAMPGAGHVQSWNVDPDEYETHTRRFLEGLGR